MYTHISLPHEQRSADLVKEFPCSCAEDITNVKCGRDHLHDLEERLAGFFRDGYAISSLLAYRTHYVDDLMCCLYHSFHLDEIEGLTLLAVGGYGRAELFLKSDIDILIASEDTLSDAASEQISAFISYLWDLKLDIGSSVRTIAETLENVNADLTVCTNLLETRFLCGN